MEKAYRILAVEACDIYRSECENGKEFGYALPRFDTDAYFWRYKNKLDYSLDLIQIEKVYKEICGGAFSFKDQYGNEYIRAVVNVKFDFSYSVKKKENETKEERKQRFVSKLNTKQLREKYYTEGFCVDGIRYVRYKRSAGSSRQGKCLFIDERLYDAMEHWCECGLTPTGDIASWEAYKALSLSAIKGTVEIPLDGILFVPDYQSVFNSDVIAVKLRDGDLVAEEENEQITNDIWDGESLLDESVFTGDYANKHMMLLRNKFFKSCAFKTKLKKWIQDKNITLQDLKDRKCVTLAKDINDIVMVTTPNSLKYIKFAGGELTEENITRWANEVDSVFGVVKCDKRTRFFGGRMVQGSYQLLNTVGLSKKQADEFMQARLDYVKTVRNDIDFMRYHFSDLCAKETDGEKPYSEDNLAERAEVLFRLMAVNNDFQQTKLYVNFRNSVVKSLKKDYLKGHILLSGTNATLFGNGPELLKYIAGEEMTSTLGCGQIRCNAFGDGQKLLCARSPHITMGNLYCVENATGGAIWDYFDLGNNIVCVNAMGENIQQRLNGCDYDSDVMLVTDEPVLVETATKYSGLFKVPVCKIDSSGAANLNLTELDYNTSENKVGEIVNLSQKLNSVIWDKLNRGDNGVQDLYLDVCKLAVLSGIEIDKAKRAYNGVSAVEELTVLYQKYGILRPNDKNAVLPPKFFKEIYDKPTPVKTEKKKTADGTVPEKPKKKKRKYKSYKTAMEYIYKCASTIDFRKNKDKFATVVRISDMLNFEPTTNSADIEASNRIIEICDRYKDIINNLYMEKRKKSEGGAADEDETSVIYDRIRDQMNERDKKVSALITNENIVYAVVTHFEKTNAVDWYIYAPLLSNKYFVGILRDSKKKLPRIIEDELGIYELYGFRYSKV